MSSHLHVIIMSYHQLLTSHHDKEQTKISNDCLPLLAKQKKRSSKAYHEDCIKMLSWQARHHERCKKDLNGGLIHEAKKNKDKPSTHYLFWRQQFSQAPKQLLTLDEFLEKCWCEPKHPCERISYLFFFNSYPSYPLTMSHPSPNLCTQFILSIKSYHV